MCFLPLEGPEHKLRYHLIMVLDQMTLKAASNCSHLKCSPEELLAEVCSEVTNTGIEIKTL